MQIDKFKDRLGKALKHWEEIEEAIKSAELLQGRVTLPAINELRYAGRQIVRAISMHGEAEFEDEFNRALTVADQYLVNADHDVIDAVIAFVGRRTDELDLRYGRAAIVARIKEYAPLCSAIDESKNLIRSARRDPKVRNTNYCDIKTKYFSEIIALNEKLVRADTLMALELAAYENQLAKQRARLLVSNLVVILLAAVVGAVLMIRYFF